VSRRVIKAKETYILDLDSAYDGCGVTFTVEVYTERGACFLARITLNDWQQRRLTKEFYRAAERRQVLLDEHLQTLKGER
jgi:hypothetical protein